MSSINRVILMGNMTRDPELKYLPSGQGITKFGLALNKKWKDRETEQIKEQVTFLTVNVWGKTGENVATYCKKGSRVLVEGELRSNTWEAQDGTKRTSVEVTAETVTFLDPPEKRGGPERDAPPPNQKRGGRSGPERDAPPPNQKRGGRSGPGREDQGYHDPGSSDDNPF